MTTDSGRLRYAVTMAQVLAIRWRLLCREKLTGDVEMQATENLAVQAEPLLADVEPHRSGT